MQTRSIINIAGLMIALCGIFATLPLQAQLFNNNGYSIPNFRYDGLDSNGDHVFSWDISSLLERVFKFQAKVPGVVDVWTTIPAVQASGQNSGRDKLIVEVPSDWAPGTKARFRLKLQQKITVNDITLTVRSKWAKLTVQLA